MVLENLHLLFFKNYEEADLSFSPHINCFIGDNGSGKTNVLDAIYYLSMGKSAFTATDLQNIKQGEEYFMVKGRFSTFTHTDTIQCTFRTGQKKIITHNKLAYEKISEHIGKYPAVLISPYDTDLIREGSEERRRYFDSLISQLDPVYLNELISYNYILKQRNSLIKQFADRNYFDKEYLQILDEQLVPAGEYITTVRQSFLENFVPIFQKHYQHLSGSSETVTLAYKSQLLSYNFIQLLQQAQRKDLLLQRTTVGPHKDDFVFLMDNWPVKNYGSQGQQKSYVIALKLSQFEIVAQRKNQKPLLLLDDIFDRLDEKRITKLLELVANNTFGQLFITDSHLERTQKLVGLISAHIQNFQVISGNVQLIN
ncbi:DNA replication and repair protein RecF [Adhaeribacter arboris]|uniref:DNA replication and repair protein RecF n=1 Tax=Adhaeribacter arboris TaxID=2072846 RepID=A0A2T2YJB8_9BACT|nr:DNA replication/repair protein RecF [Adhaeribacter arboris]PSR55598.1 DNA replication and repair protein RecF [Adhaeribacter arboris]